MRFYQLMLAVAFTILGVSLLNLGTNANGWKNLVGVCLALAGFLMLIDIVQAANRWDEANASSDKKADDDSNLLE